VTQDRSSEFADAAVADIVSDGQAVATVLPPQTGFFGHPRGLATLFFTEMWERFSYYGMRALLILFMTATAAEGGLGFDVAKAGAIYGLYTALVYLACLPGGWIADRFLGQRRSVLWGGIVIALGHFSMAVPSLSTFYVGLGLIVVGTGMLKPNISTMVGQLYGPEDNRRDAGFTIFYMGINIGAFIAPLICGYLGENINWHYGFAMAGIGMVLGLIQYGLGDRHLGLAGKHPIRATDPIKRQREVMSLRVGLLSVLGIVALIMLVAVTGILPITAEGVSNSFGMILLATVVVFFGWLFFLGDWTVRERRQLYVIGVLFLGASLFWSAFEQAGTTLNLFAADRTDRDTAGWIASLLRLSDGTFPASWFQSLNPLFIISLAPLVAWLWVALGRRNPSSPAKFAVGLFFVGLGFAVLIVGAILSAGGVQVSPMWLVVTYLLHTIGELTLSPVGLSAMTKLAPARVASLMMGVWFMASAVGNYMGGFLARFYESMALPTLFGTVASFTVGAGLILALLVKPIKRMLERPE